MIICVLNEGFPIIITISSYAFKTLIFFAMFKIIPTEIITHLLRIAEFGRLFFTENYRKKSAYTFTTSKLKLQLQITAYILT